MPFASVTSISNYEGLMRDLVVRMKSRNGHSVAIQMGRWLAQILQQATSDSRIGTIDYVTPTPSHWTRKIQRGFNVSALLVESICRHSKLAGQSRHLLVANRKTGKQGTLTLAQRFDNVKNCFAFSGKPDIAGASILLVDDVMTSGATAIQAGNILKSAGADQIHLALVARGIGRQP